MARRALLLNAGGVSGDSTSLASSSSRSSSLSPTALSPRRHITLPASMATSTKTNAYQHQHQYQHQYYHPHHHHHHHHPNHSANTSTTLQDCLATLHLDRCLPQTRGSRALSMCIVTLLVVAINLLVVVSHSRRTSTETYKSSSRSSSFNFPFASAPRLRTNSMQPRGSDARLEEERQGWRLTPVSATDDKDARVAFFIQVSEPTVNLLPRLLRTLHDRRNVYAIHFDRKISNATRLVALSHIRAENKYDNNVFIMQSDIITYRGVSMLLNTISAIRFLRSLSRRPGSEGNLSWDYFINLSAADYPLLTPQTMRTILGREKGLNFFSFADRSTWAKMAENRLSEIWFDDALSLRNRNDLHTSQPTITSSNDQASTHRQGDSEGRMSTKEELTKLPVRNPLVDRRGFEVSHAEAWMVLSRDFCNFILDSDVAQTLLLSFSFAVDSSEHYFATAAWNAAQFQSTIVPHSLRLIVWMHDGIKSGQHPFYIDEHSKNDSSFTFKARLQHAQVFFARKFREPDSQLMQWIDDRATQADVVQKATAHFLHKVQTRRALLAQL